MAGARFGRGRMLLMSHEYDSCDENRGHSNRQYLKGMCPKVSHRKGHEERELLHQTAFNGGTGIWLPSLYYIFPPSSAKISFRIGCHIIYMAWVGGK